MQNVDWNGCDGGLAPQEHTLVVQGMRWHYLKWGVAGPSLILWHGVTSDAWTWWRIGPQLAARGFQVYAPDLPGHGRSADAPESYAVADTARLLDEWLVAIGVEQPTILGHSWGGLNALIHATLPDAQVRARALILEDPALKMPNDPEHHIPSFTTGLGSPRTEQSVIEIQALNPRWHPCDVWWKAQARELTRHSAVKGFFVDNVALDAVDQLNQLRVPTLLLLADPSFGGIWSRQHVDIVERTASPHVGLRVIEGSSHNMHRDSFEPFITAIEQFVQQAVL